MRTSIWLIRHGQTTLNRERRYQGSSDPPLTPYGQRQAEALAERLRRLPFDTAIVGPHQRAQATTETILRNRTATTIIDPRWAEVNHGAWEGLTYAEVRARFPAEAAARFSDPLHGRASGGESLAEVAARVGAAWRELPQRYPGGRLLIVTSATPIQIVLCLFSGTPIAEHWRWRVDLGSVTAFDSYASATILRVANEVPRLQR
jgi:alpha-ribazole phosphatase